MATIGVKLASANARDALFWRCELGAGERRKLDAQSGGGDGGGERSRTRVGQRARAGHIATRPSTLARGDVHTLAPARARKNCLSVAAQCRARTRASDERVRPNGDVRRRSIAEGAIKTLGSSRKNSRISDDDKNRGSNDGGSSSNERAPSTVATVAAAIVVDKNVEKLQSERRANVSPSAV